MPLTDVGGDDQDLARSRLGVRLAGRNDRLLGTLLGELGLLTAPVDVTPNAVFERRRCRPAELAPARSLETILPPKSPGRAGV